ncbi:MAG: hypothetical protein IPO07_11320 [Haliscomenobacter sp.]|nr:hypothetical protein [Haliscomenobacter sp.]MBK9489304.1 hypothetical protein [Haliscomenobacter sp.]
MKICVICGEKKSALSQKRIQLSLFIHESASASIETIRAAFNPAQYALDPGTRDAVPRR